MNQAQRDILFWLKESKKERGLSVPQIASKVKRNESKVIVELGILQENNLIECQISPRGRIKSAKINSQGESHFSEATKIVSRESVKDQIAELKDRVLSLENAYKDFQNNPTDDNKKSFMEKLDTFQSVVNGVAPIIKTGWDLLK
jgi:hypothetical protein